MDDKLTSADGKRFWRQLQRFAEYEDMKDLYSKVIPEIAKFEQKIMDFEVNVQKNDLIIRQFDETIAHKSDKILLEKLKMDSKKMYASKEEQNDFILKLEDTMSANQDAFQS